MNEDLRTTAGYPETNNWEIAYTAISINVVGNTTRQDCKVIWVFFNIFTILRL